MNLFVCGSLHFWEVKACHYVLRFVPYFPFFPIILCSINYLNALFYFFLVSRFSVPYGLFQFFFAVKLLLPSKFPCCQWYRTIQYVCPRSFSTGRYCVHCSSQGISKLSVWYKYTCIVFYYFCLQILTMH